MKRIIVSGGAGFIGSHLCDRLIEQEHKVVCIDNFCTGDKENIKHLLGHPNFELREHDIINPTNFGWFEVDEVYNLACPASPKAFAVNPIFTLKTSFMGTLNMLGLAKRHRAKFLQASTSEIYGEPDVHPQKEDYWGHVNPIGERACYSEGKRVAESLVINYHRVHKLDTRIIRIFNVYGPRMRKDDGRAIPNIITQIVSGEPITMYGDGQHTRSFCYVDDMVNGLIKLMTSNITTPVNIGNPHEITIKHLAETIAKLMGKENYPTIDCPLPGDDATKRCPSIEKAKNLLGWQPTIELEDGLRKVIEYYTNK